MLKDIQITQAINGFVVHVKTIPEKKGKEKMPASPYAGQVIPVPTFSTELYVCKTVEELTETIKKIYQVK